MMGGLKTSLKCESHNMQEISRLPKGTANGWFENLSLYVQEISIQVG